MKIILLKDVDKLGKAGDVKQVANGYGRNFLIPKKLAVLATKSELSKLDQQKKIEVEKAEEELFRFQEIASQLDGLEVEIKAKAGEEGKLFGAITPTQVVKSLAERGFEIDVKHIIIENPIKDLGEHEVTIEFPHNLEVKIKLIVAEDASEKDKKNKGGKEE